MHRLVWALPIFVAGVTWEWDWKWGKSEMGNQSPNKRQKTAEDIQRISAAYTHTVHVLRIYIGFLHCVETLFDNQVNSFNRSSYIQSIFSISDTKNCLKAFATPTGIQQETDVEESNATKMHTLAHKRHHIILHENVLQNEFQNFMDTFTREYTICNHLVVVSFLQIDVTSLYSGATHELPQVCHQFCLKHVHTCHNQTPLSEGLLKERSSPKSRLSNKFYFFRKIHKNRTPDFYCSPKLLSR